MCKANIATIQHNTTELHQHNGYNPYATPVHTSSIASSEGTNNLYNQEAAAIESLNPTYYQEQGAFAQPV